MKPQRKILCLIWGLVCGVSLIIGGFLALYLFEPLVKSIIENTVPILPDSDVTKAWIAPPIRPVLKIYYFNVTNPEEYLSGGKLRVQEIGPYVFQEKWKREGIKWTDDQEEVSFRMKKTYHHRPDLSSGSLSDPVVLPNVPMFGMLSKLRNTGPSVLESGNAYLGTFDPPQNVFEKRTVQEVTWGYNHSLVHLANLILQEEEILPELYGYFYGKNNSDSGEWNIMTGKSGVNNLGSVVNIEKRSTVDTWFDRESKLCKKIDWNDEETLPPFLQKNKTLQNLYQTMCESKSTTCNKIKGTDGSVFPPFLGESSVLRIYNKDMCRSLPLKFSEKINHFNMETYRFIPSKTAFSSGDSSCFCPPGSSGCAPEGLFNVSACHGGSPMLLSWPHFYNADPKLLENIHGLKPEKEKHEFQIDVLPQIGVGLRAAVRMQINLFIEVDGIQKLENATNAYVPIIWFQDGIENLDDEELIDQLQAAILQPPLIQSILYPVLFTTGIFVILLNIFLLYRNRKKSSKSTFGGSVEMDSKSNF